jgi:hypothetical protein
MKRFFHAFCATFSVSPDASLLRTRAVMAWRGRMGGRRCDQPAGVPGGAGAPLPEGSPRFSLHCLLAILIAGMTAAAKARTTTQQVTLQPGWKVVWLELDPEDHTTQVDIKGLEVGSVPLVWNVTGRRVLRGDTPDRPRLRRSTATRADVIGFPLQRNGRHLSGNHHRHPQESPGSSPTFDSWIARGTITGRTRMNRAAGNALSRTSTASRSNSSSGNNRIWLINAVMLTTVV